MARSAHPAATCAGPDVRQRGPGQRLCPEGPDHRRVLGRHPGIQPPGDAAGLGDVTAQPGQLGLDVGDPQVALRLALLAGGPVGPGHVGEGRVVVAQPAAGLGQAGVHLRGVLPVGQLPRQLDRLLQRGDGLVVASVEGGKLGLAHQRQGHAPPVAQRLEPGECLGALAGHVAQPAQVHRVNACMSRAPDRIHGSAESKCAASSRSARSGSRCSYCASMAGADDHERMRRPDGAPVVPAGPGSREIRTCASASGCLTPLRSQFALSAVSAQRARACTTSRPCSPAPPGRPAR